PEEAVALDGYLGAALGEGVAHLGGDAGEVGLASSHVAPLDAEAVGELAAQGGVVDPADGALLVLEEAGVEGEPSAGRVLDLGRDQGVGVQLGVDRPGGVLAEQGGRRASGVDLVGAVSASSGDGTVLLEPVEC